MEIKSFYNELKKIFVDYTTNIWKNNWENEGELYDGRYQKLTHHNLFLLRATDKSTNGKPLITLEGPNRFQITIRIKENNEIRIVIEHKHIRIRYYIDNKLDWSKHKLFLLDICQNIYDANVKIKECFSNIPKIFSIKNPNFANSTYRNKIIKELII